MIKGHKSEIEITIQNVCGRGETKAVKRVLECKVGAMRFMTTVSGLVRRCFLNYNITFQK